jgi:nucleotide-binding universal stress UspA family protein
MQTREPGRVIVGISPTLAGYQALRYAAGEARSRGAQLVAVRTYRSTNYGQGVSWREVDTQAATDVLVATFRDALGGNLPDVDAQMLIRNGTPGSVLAAVASRPDDLVVIGGATARRLVGRHRAIVARQLARSATCPVVIVPPPAMSRAGRTSRLARSVAHGAETFLQSVELNQDVPRSL